MFELVTGRVGFIGSRLVERPLRDARNRSTAVRRYIEHWGYDEPGRGTG